MEEHYLIVGLGNPGRTYDDTRHNIGFRVLKAFAEKHGISFRPSLFRAKGSLGKGKIQEKMVHLLMPLTYMNESGVSVRKCLDYFKIQVGNLLVITDDVALPFKAMRLRKKGSCGGHNGLRSVETHLGTNEYPRMRIGVGNPSVGELADYVLGRFTKEEQADLPRVVEESIEGAERWLACGIDSAMKEINTLGEDNDKC